MPPHVHELQEATMPHRALGLLAILALGLLAAPLATDAQPPKKDVGLSSLLIFSPENGGRSTTSRHIRL
jgi:hypothetical protein